MPPKETSPTANKKLNKDELEAVAKRLHDQQMEKKAALEQKRQETLEKSTFKQPPLTEESTQNLVQRVYTSQLEKKKRHDEQRQKELEAAHASTKTLSESETADMVQRMFYQQQERQQKGKAALETKYRPEPEHKKLEKEQQEAMASRLSRGVHQKKQEVRAKLFDKYIAPMEPEKKTITQEQLKTMADRLCTTKGK
jgi:hypothetical protein